MKSIAFIALAALAGFASAAPILEYEEAKALADKDEKSLAPAESATLLKSQGELLNAGVAACATPAPDLSPFTVAMELDAQGKIVRTWLRGSSPLGICFRKYVSGRTLIVPPRVPFHASIELSFTK